MIVVEGRDIGGTDVGVPAGSRVEARQQVHERGLTRTGGAHDCGELALREVHVYAVERADDRGTRTVVLGQSACGHCDGELLDWRVGTVAAEGL